jgi:hypothetical protein
MILSLSKYDHRLHSLIQSKAIELLKGRKIHRGRFFCLFGLLTQFSCSVRSNGSAVWRQHGVQSIRPYSDPCMRHCSQHQDTGFVLSPFAVSFTYLLPLLTLPQRSSSITYFMVSREGYQVWEKEKLETGQGRVPIRTIDPTVSCMHRLTWYGWLNGTRFKVYFCVT